jgi:hypothetical protein
MLESRENSEANKNHKILEEGSEIAPPYYSEYPISCVFEVIMLGYAIPALGPKKLMIYKCLIYKRNLQKIQIIYRCNIRQGVKHPELHMKHLSLHHDNI